MRNIFLCHMRQTKGLEAGAVDQVAAIGQVIQTGAGGCVSASSQCLRVLLGQCACIRDQGIEQGGFTHAALSQQ